MEEKSTASIEATPEQILYAKILEIGMYIGLLILFLRGDLWYNLVLIWAYIGILLKQTAPPGDYVSIGFTALGLAVVLLAASIVVVVRRRGIYQ